MPFFFQEISCCIRIEHMQCDGKLRLTLDHVSKHENGIDANLIFSFKLLRSTSVKVFDNGTYFILFFVLKLRHSE